MLSSVFLLPLSNWLHSYAAMLSPVSPFAFCNWLHSYAAMLSAALSVVELLCFRYVIGYIVVLHFSVQS